MINPIEVYNAIDSFLVDRSTEAVKVWNWTTGRTKADLANLVSLFGCGLNAASAWFGERPVNGSDYLMASVWVFIGVMNTNGNIEIERREINSLETKDWWVEEHKRKNKICGPISCGFGEYFTLSGLEKENLEYKMLGQGFILIGLSDYIMRAENQKPRKDCVRRGLGKLAEYARSLSPGFEPIPIGSGSRYQTLEGYLD